MSEVDSSAAVSAEAADNVEASEAIEAAENTEAVEQAAAEQKPEASSSKRKFKLKVDGEEIEEEFDLSNEAELIKHLQLAKVASKRMQSEAMTKRQAQSLVEAIRKNPEQALADLGINPSDFAESLLAKQLEEQLLTPEQKEIREARRIVEEYKKQQEEQSKSKEQQEMQALEQRYADEYQRTIIEALEASGLPKNRRSMARIASAMKLSLAKGLNFDPKHLAKMAREDYESDLKELLSSFQDEDSLLGFMGDAADRIRKADLKRLKAQAPKQKFETPKPTQESSSEQRRKLTLEEWRKKMESMKD